MNQAIEIVVVFGILRPVPIAQKGFQMSNDGGCPTSGILRGFKERVSGKEIGMGNFLPICDVKKFLGPFIQRHGVGAALNVPQFRFGQNKRL